MKLIKRAISLVAKYILPLFLLSLVLLKIPPFYLIFPIKSSLLTTPSLSRMIIAFLFLIIILAQVFQGKMLHGKKERVVLAIFLVYFAFQSLSIISAQNMASFLQRYKDILFPGLFLFVALILNKHKRKVIMIFSIVPAFNFVYQMIMFWFPSFFQSLASIFVYEKHLELGSINLERGRLFIETYDEIAIPFLFVLIPLCKKRWQKVAIFLLFGAIAIPSFLSNFRSRILMFAFAFLASFFFLSTKKIVSRMSFLISLLIITYFTATLLSSVLGFSFVDRFALRHEREDIRTIESRGSHIKESAEMGLAFPVTGVGLGNYYEYLSATKTNSASVFGWVKKETAIASTSPHNIFAQIVSETGVISLLFYVGMLGFFARNDLKLLFNKKAPDITKSFAISFWSLFLYSVFNPTTTLTYNALFWILRGMI